MNRNGADERHERDPDGVRVVARPGGASRARLYQGLALLLTSVCVGYALTPRPAAAPLPDARPHKPVELSDEVLAAAKAAEDGTAPVEAAAPAPAASGPTARPITPRRTENKPAEAEEEPPELPIPPDRIKDVTMGEYIQALHDAGIYEGLGAFNPPGTKPPLEGVAVPEDFELPEGYVRHYQATDDGQAIEPILMYSPDYEFFDESGNRIELPEDRVVPPEHVPPGLEPRIIDIPKPREPGDLRR